MSRSKLVTLPPHLRPAAPSLPAPALIVREPAIEPDEMLIALDQAASKSYRQFVELAWHVLEPSTPFVPNWHIDALCDILEAVARFQILRIVINIPPGCMKSWLVSKAFIPWVWGPFGQPERRSINAAYVEALSIRDSVDARAIIASPWYQDRWPLALSDDQDTKHKFLNEKRGFRMSIPRGGGTGEHAHHLTADDPHPTDPQKQDSKDTVEGVHGWWEKTMSSRGVGETETTRLVCMQRLAIAPVDLSGHVLRSDAPEEYELFCLPMEHEPSRLVDRNLPMRVRPPSSIPTPAATGFVDPRMEEGDLLWPAKYSRAYVNAQKATLGTFEYVGQYQQRPAPREGGIIKRAWIKYWFNLPNPTDVTQRLHSWDMAFKGKEDSSPVCGQAWIARGADYYLTDQVRERMTFTVTCDTVVSFSAKHPLTMLKLVEDKANGPAVIDVLQHKVPGLVGEPVEGGDKDARLKAVSPLFEAGNIWVPDPSLSGMGWVHDYVEELCGEKPGNKDQRDTTAQALRRLSKGGSGGGLQIYGAELCPHGKTTFEQCWLCGRG